MKRKKWLLILVIALGLIYYLLPGGTVGTPQSVPTEQPEEALNLLSTPPDSAAEYTPAPEPVPEPTAPGEAGSAETQAPTAAEAIREDGVYQTKEDVALYVHTYGRLPSNFITKKEAEAAGWQGGPLDKVLPGMCIGGDRFGNYEGKLPEARGRKWTECDLNTIGARYRGAERLIFSNDGLIYYTPDHYETFELLYG